MIILMLTALFDKIAASPSQDIELQCIYLEIYNETIRDLLSPSTPELDLRTDHNNVPSTPGATRITLSSIAQSIGLLRLGNTRRSTEPTQANAVSSRSHAIFSVSVLCKHTHAKLSMVDLAGSERAAGTGNRGARMIEGAAINRSLLALGNCINKLAGVEDDGARVRKAKKDRGYVNYRDSKLTRILSDSLGGNCRTIMIAACSPGSTSFEETCNTLKYAARARSITNDTAPVPRIWDADGTRRLFDDELEVATPPPVAEKTIKATSSEELMTLFERIVKTQTHMIASAGLKEDQQTKDMIAQAEKLKALMEFKKKTHRRLKSKVLTSSKSSASLAPEKKETESAFDLMPRHKPPDRAYHHNLTGDYLSPPRVIQERELKPLNPLVKAKSRVQIHSPSPEPESRYIAVSQDTSTPAATQTTTISMPQYTNPSQPQKSTTLLPISIPRHLSNKNLTSPIQIPSPLFGPADDHLMLQLTKVGQERKPATTNQMMKEAVPAINRERVSRDETAPPRQRSKTDQPANEGVFRRIAKVFQPKLSRNPSHPVSSFADRKPIAVATVAPQLFEQHPDERIEQMKKAYAPQHPKPSKPRVINVK